MLVALRRLNNATIQFIVLLHIILNFFTFITPIRHVYNHATSRASRVCVRTA